MCAVAYRAGLLRALPVECLKARAFNIGALIITITYSILEVSFV